MNNPKLSEAGRPPVSRTGTGVPPTSVIVVQPSPPSPSASLTSSPGSRLRTVINCCKKAAVPAVMGAATLGVAAEAANFLTETTVNVSTVEFDLDVSHIVAQHHTAVRAGVSSNAAVSGAESGNDLFDFEAAVRSQANSLRGTLQTVPQEVLRKALPFGHPKRLFKSFFDIDAPPPTCARTDNIERSFPNSPMKHRFITLKNGIKVLLTSDPTSPITAGSLVVRAGWHNNCAPGAANLARDCLVQGPKGNWQQKAVDCRGGFQTETDGCRTTFSFFSDPDKFSEVADSFAASLAAPQLPKEVVEGVVDFNNEKFQQERLLYRNQLNRIIEKTFYHPDSPYARFAECNRDILNRGPGGKPYDVTQIVQSFYNKFYSAHEMCLSLAGSQSLDELEAIATRTFSIVPRKNVKIPRGRALAGHIPGPESFKKIISWVPTDDVRLMTFAWLVDDYLAFHSSKPWRFIIAALLGPGKTSLLTRLKNEGLADSTVCTDALSPTGMSQNPGGERFEMSFVLTEKGDTSEGRARIGEIVFESLKRLRETKLPDWFLQQVVKESRQIAAPVVELSNALSLAVSSANMMPFMPPNKVVEGTLTIDEIDKDAIQHFVNQLQIDNMQMYVASKGVAAKCNQTEEFYGIKYGTEPIPADLLKRWKGAGKGPAVPAEIPDPNPFVSDVITSYVGKNPPKKPKLLPNDNGVRVFYHPDTTGSMVNAICTLQITPGTKDPKALALMALLATLAMQGIDEAMNLVFDAGLRISVVSTPSGTLEVNVIGPGDKHAQALQLILNSVKNPKLTPEAFAECKTVVLLGMDAALKSPFHVAHTESLAATRPSMVSQSDVHLAMKLATLEDMKNFVANNRLFAHCYIDGIVSGNVSEQTAMQVLNNTVTTLGVKKQASWTQPPPSDWVDLSNGRSNPTRYQFRTIVPNCETSYAAITMQVGKLKPLERVFLHLFCELTDEIQKEYFAGNEEVLPSEVSPLDWGKAMAGLTLALSGNIAVADVRRQLEGFILQMTKPGGLLTEDRFNECKKSVATKICAPAHDALPYHETVWNEIRNRSFDFDEFANVQKAFKDPSCNFQAFMEFLTKKVRNASWICAEVAGDRTPIGRVDVPEAIEYVRVSDFVEVRQKGRVTKGESLPIEKIGVGK